MTRLLRTCSLSAALLTLGASPLLAQAPPPAAAAASSGAASAAPQPADDPDLDPNNAQPDFFVATMPTTLRMPRHKMAFRLTHRFGRPLGQGNFGDLLADGLGFDTGAVMGFGLNYGLFGGAQIGFYRTADRTIQFSAQYEVLNQKSAPVGLAVVANMDGTNNFQDSYSPGIQAVVSREIGDHGALYVAPAYVNNSAELPKALVDDNDTILVAVGARMRLRKNTYVFLEASPRVSGYSPGTDLVSFGIEQRAGGHLFQLNFSNGLGTTLAQVARGGSGKKDYYIGFNLTRKFY